MTSKYLAMDQELIKQILEGSTSNVEDIAKQNEEALTAVSRSKCSRCGSYLLPRISIEAGQVFDGVRPSYVGWCPHCRSFTE